MDVNAVNNTGAITPPPAPNAVNPPAPNAANPAGTEEKNGENQNQAAIYEPSEKPNAAYKPDYNKLKVMLAESERQIAAFQKLIENLVGKQAQKYGTAQGWDGVQGLKEFIGSLEVDEETRAQAQRDIDEGGYYSVDETAKRLLSFAVALSGGDPGKIELLRGAVEKGFEEAAKMWGDELPEISQKTYEAVMNGFDEWEKAGSSAAITLLQN